VTDGWVGHPSRKGLSSGLQRVGIGGKNFKRGRSRSGEEGPYVMGFEVEATEISSIKYAIGCGD